MFELYKDNKKVFESASDWGIVKWLHDNHAYSISHAFTHEGYTLWEGGMDITKKYILKFK